VSAGLPSAAEKPGYVAAMFARIARRYDLMNSLMTFGQDARWRRILAESVSRLGPRARVLDVGTGTGRLAQAVLDRDPSLRVVGVDFTLAMLRVAPRQLELAAGDAAMLPFTDGQFDAVVSGFLVRNLADIDRGLAEQVRVLRPGGLVAVLETTPGPTGVLRPLHRLYFRHVVRWLGRLVAGDSSAYTYLPESTLAFLEPARFAELLVRMGLEDVRTQRLAFGSIAVTCARKPIVMLVGAGEIC
jgi:demethylmenaquinone methyltransferase/2-methoxy-6-polyprenyl-1,4-benzoquinol methylase